MSDLTVAFITARRSPRFNWFCDSLARQITTEAHRCHILAIDHFQDEDGRRLEFYQAFHNAFRSGDGSMLEPRFGCTFEHRSPKPSIWKGRHRITKEDWWSKSSDLNSAIALCTTDFIAFVDDRCILWRAWLDRVRVAMEEGYAVCGSYEKWANLEVKDGAAVGGELLGEDTRTPGNYPFDSLYGGSTALPLEWCLAVNGYPEICDGLGLEDSLFGTLIRNNGYPIRYDSDMRLIEDRTPSQLDGALKRADKNVHLGRGAKSWALVGIMEDKTSSQNPYDIRNLRDRVLLNGEDLNSIPPTGSAFDFYDNQPLSEMT